jgi:hypothetical protein
MMQAGGYLLAGLYLLGSLYEVAVGVEYQGIAAFQNVQRSATATHAVASPMTCGVYYGGAAPPLASTVKEGTIACE